MVSANPLENAVAIEQPVIEDGHLRVLFVVVLAVDVNLHGQSAEKLRKASRLGNRGVWKKRWREPSSDSARLKRKRSVGRASCPQRLCCHRRLRCYAPGT